MSIGQPLLEPGQHEEEVSAALAAIGARPATRSNENNEANNCFFMDVGLLMVELTNDNLDANIFKKNVNLPSLRNYENDPRE